MTIEPQSLMSLWNNVAAVMISFYQREKRLCPSLRNPYQSLVLSKEPECLKKTQPTNQKPPNPQK